MKLISKCFFYALLLFLLAGFVGPIVFFPFELAFHLILGWIPFLGRTLSKLTVNWSALAFAVICSAVTVAGVQQFGRWVCAHRQQRMASGKSGAWKWRWSFGIYAGLWLLFGTTVAMTGAVHQIAWMITSGEPLVDNRMRPAMAVVQLKRTGAEVLLVADDAGPTLSEVREALLEERRWQRVLSAADVHTLLLGDQDGNLTSILVFHRDPGMRQRAGLVVFSRGNPPEVHPSGRLSNLLGAAASVATVP